MSTFLSFFLELAHPITLRGRASTSQESDNWQKRLSPDVVKFTQVKEWNGVSSWNYGSLDFKVRADKRISTRLWLQSRFQYVAALSNRFFRYFPVGKTEYIKFSSSPAPRPRECGPSLVESSASLQWRWWFINAAFIPFSLTQLVKSLSPLSHKRVAVNQHPLWNVFPHLLICESPLMQTLKSLQKVRKLKLKETC